MINFYNKDYDYATRLDLGKFVSLDELRPSIITSWFISQVKQIKDFTYFKITREVGFSDYVSCSVYDTNHSFWWIIKIYNNILDEDELTEGSIIKIPSEEALNKLVTELRMNETLYNNEDYNSLTIYK